jgi:hypothetical protein
MKSKLLPITLLIILSMILASCAPAPAPEPQVIEKQVEVTTVVEKVVEVEKEVEKVVEVEKEVEVLVTAVPAGPNPYRPNDLFEVVEKLQAATAGKSAPAGAKYASNDQCRCSVLDRCSDWCRPVLFRNQCADHFPGPNRRRKTFSTAFHA